MPPEIHVDPVGIDWSNIIADQEAIRKLNPQRFEMEQLTAVVFMDTAQQIVAGYKDIQADEFWVRGHMPGYPLYPGVLMCEAAAQLCGFYITVNQVMAGDFCAFGGLENVRFRAPVRIGDRLLLIAKATRLNRRQTVCNVQGFVGSTMVFHADVIGVPLTNRRVDAVRHRSRLPLEQLQPFLLDMPTPEQPLDWAALFNQQPPTEMEVGFGKGLFLITAGEQHPHINYLGIEIERGYQLYAATRLAKRQRTNVKLVCGDARVFLRDAVPSAALQALHIYFPDPWWKHRHKKRRVFTPEFAAQAAHILCPGGRLHIATDVQEYFGVMHDLVAQQPELQPIPLPSEGEGESTALTNFERKYRLQGRPIFRAVYVRRPGE